MLSGGLARQSSIDSSASALAREPDACTAASEAFQPEPTTLIRDSLMLLESVYGPIDDPGFPRPLPEREAGTCANGDRRYLWTDALAVLTLTSIADALERMAQPDSPVPSQYGGPERYRRAADALISAVHNGLGTPRSSSAADAMRSDDRSPTGFVGLRIGKPHSSSQTDPGAGLDGQYWHFVDKWLLALVRAGHADDAAAIGKVVFEDFFDKGPTGDGQAGGIRWKLAVDATAPREFEQTYPNDDTLVALIIYNLLEHHRSEGAQSLREEVDLLHAAMRGYETDVTSDALGWGFQTIYNCYLKSHPWNTLLNLTGPAALDMRHLVELPFRLYGAILGARVAATCGQPVANVAAVEALLACGLEHERRAAREKPGAKRDAEHSALSRVMLAACCVATPGAFAPQDGEPLLELKL